MTAVSVSAGVLLFRGRPPSLEVMLVHPGGPFWRNKDTGAWQIPKGLIEPGEDPEVAALREFSEETGQHKEDTPFLLGEIRQKAGKRVLAFALEGTFDPARLASNTFELQWPPHSGRIQTFAEIDRAAWFGIEEARVAMLESQIPILDMLVSHLERETQS